MTPLRAHRPSPSLRRRRPRRVNRRKRLSRSRSRSAFCPLRARSSRSDCDHADWRSGRRLHPARGPALKSALMALRKSRSLRCSALFRAGAAGVPAKRRRTLAAGRLMTAIASTAGRRSRVSPSRMMLAAIKEPARRACLRSPLLRGARAAVDRGVRPRLCGRGSLVSLPSRTSRGRSARMSIPTPFSRRATALLRAHGGGARGLFARDL